MLRFLHPQANRSKSTSCSPRQLSSSGPAPLLAPAPAPPPPRPQRTGSTGPPHELRSRLAQKGNFSLHYYLHYLEVHFYYPSLERFFLSLLESGCSLGILILPLRFYFGSEDQRFSAGRWGGGGLFRWGEGEGNIRREAGGCGGGLLEVAAELGPETRGPGAAMGMV